MSSFKDTLGREWELSLTAGMATRIREVTGIPILLVATVEGVDNWRGAELPADPVKFVDALWLFVAKQAEKKGVTRSEFEDAFGEKTYEDAAAAYFDAVISFSHLPAVFRKMFGTGREMILARQQAVIETLKTMENSSVMNSAESSVLTHEI